MRRFFLRSHYSRPKLTKMSLGTCCPPRENWPGRASKFKAAQQSGGPFGSRFIHLYYLGQLSRQLPCFFVASRRLHSRRRWDERAGTALR